jgi:hypothetical protein
MGMRGVGGKRQSIVVAEESIELPVAEVDDKPDRPREPAADQPEAGQ